MVSVAGNKKVTVKKQLPKVNINIRLLYLPNTTDPSVNAAHCLQISEESTGNGT